MVILDQYMAFSTPELLERIRDLTVALVSPEQSASSKDVGSFTSKAPSAMRAQLASMQRAYAVRMGIPVPRRGIRYTRVDVVKDYFE